MDKLVYLTIAFAIFQPGILFPNLESFHPFYLICALTLTAFFASKYRRVIASIASSDHGIFLSILIICESIPIILNSSWISGAFQVIVEWMKIIIVFIFITAIINSYEKIKRTFWVIILSSTIVFFKGLEILFYYPEMMRDGRLSSYGMYGGANDFALLIVLIWPLAFKMLEINKIIILRVLLFFFLGLITYLLIYTISRGGIIGFLVVSALCLCFGDTDKIALNNFKKIMVIPLVIIVGGISLSQLAVRKDTQSFGMDDSSSLNRINAWKAGAKMMINIPWGVGYGNFDEYASSYGAKKGIEAHNTLIKVGAEAGFIGLFSYISLIYVTFKAFLKNIRRFKNIKHYEIKALVQGLMISLIGFCICTFFSVKEYEFLLYIILGLGFAVSKIEGSNLNDYGKIDFLVVFFFMIAFFVFIKLLPV